MTRQMDGWMTGQMDELMLHVTTSFNICNNLNPMHNAHVCVYLTIHIRKLVNNKKEKKHCQFY